MGQGRPFLRGPLAAVLLAAALIPISGRAQQLLSFPPAASTSSDAAAAFDDRALAVITYNGCNREVEFNQFVMEIKKKDYDHQGSPLTDLVLAKIALFLRGAACQAVASLPCPNAGCPSPGQAALFLPACASFTPSFRPPSYTVSYTLSNACLRKQINDTLLTYAAHDQIGSTGAPCLPVLGGNSLATSTKGEYDVNLREIVRALFLGSRTAPAKFIDDASRALDKGTIEYLVTNLLTAKGPPGPDSYSVVFGCGNLENETGSAQDYADSQSWLNRAAGSLGDAGDYLLRRWFLWLALYFLGPLGPLEQAAQAAIPAVGGIPPVLDAAGTAAVVFDPFPFARYPETENHRLQTETSRFLTNQEMISELNAAADPNVDIVQSQQAETKEWLLTHLQSIARKDFEEYNARPYGNYSLNAVVNLYDFSTDPDIKTAARIVLDFQAAKAAVGGNRARRYAPFRRRQEYDGYEPEYDGAARLYNKVEGSDEEIVRMEVLAGQTQLGERPGAAKDETNPLNLDAAEGFVNPAVSDYRLEDPILELAVERRNVFERVHHAGVEIYSARASFVLTGGGVQAPPANEVYGQGTNVDKGVALPIVVVPTDGGLDIPDLIRLEGTGGIGAYRINNACMSDGFACGVGFVRPKIYDDCTDNNLGAPSPQFFQWLFINSTNCATAGLAKRALEPPIGQVPTYSTTAPFYLAAAYTPCATDDGNSVCAVIEVVDAPGAVAGADPGFDAFKASRRAAFTGFSALTGAPGTWSGTYRTVDDRLISFTIPTADREIPSGGIISIDGAPMASIDNWPFATGPVTSAGDGFTLITGSNGKMITLDFRDKDAPKWSKNY